MTYLALPWFVLVTTGSPGKMSLVLAAEILPMAILGVPSGALVQRLGSRTTMLVADFARAPILASIPLLYSAGVLDFGLLLAMVALLGAFAPPYFAAQRTILPELVGEDETRMSQANSSIEGGNALAALLGPALAGVLIPFVGAPNVLYVDAATYLVAFVLVLVFVPSRQPIASAAQKAVLAGAPVPRIRQAARAARRHDHRVRLPRSRNVAGLPYYAYDQFGGRSWIAGLFYAALGAGAVVGSIAAVLVVRRVPPLRPRRVRDPRVLDPTLGYAVPAALARRLRRPLPRDVVHAARERADSWRPDLAHASRAPSEGHDCSGSPRIRLPHRSGSSWPARSRALGRRAAVRRRRARHHVDGDRVRGHRVAALGRRAAAEFG
jgi:MFS family permease